MSKKDFQLGYRPSLDGLRGISILAVMALHSGSVFTYGGFLGVDVFFVISGFLITSLLLHEWDRTGSISLKDFYMRRALRLLPALLVVLTVFAIYAAWFVPDQKTATQAWKTIFCALFYLSNWVQAYEIESCMFLPLTHTWSLSIEEQFYLLWPVILRTLLGLKLQRKTIVWLTLGGILASAVSRIMLLYFGAPNARLYNGLDTRADALLTGCLIGLLLYWNLLPKLRQPFTNTNMTLAATLTLTFLLMGMSANMSSLYYGIFTLVAASVAGIIIAVMTSPPRFLTLILEFPPLVWIGRISYGLYLWHFPVLFFPRKDRFFGMSSLAALFFCYGMTFVIAAVSFYWLEAPILRLKKRFTPVPQPRP